MASVSETKFAYRLQPVIQPDRWQHSTETMADCSAIAGQERIVIQRGSMFILHCTKKAQNRLKVKPSDVLSEPTTRLGNWYCNEFTASRRKYLVFVNERTLLPVVISVKGLKTNADILELFKQRVFKTFLFMNLSDDKFMPEILEMDDVVFAKTASRSVVGSMNDIIAQAKFSSDYHEIDVDSPAMFEHLSQIPLKANGYKRSTGLVAELLQC